MATPKEPSAELQFSSLSSSDQNLLTSVRQGLPLVEAGLMQPLNAVISPIVGKRGITFWEQLGCVGYNPDRSLLEATITLKRSDGYGGGTCTAGSTEYVRFFVDWDDGHGWTEVGLASVQVFDVSDAPAGPQHPLQYMVSVLLQTGDKARVCSTPVLPKVRAILSWRALPPVDADQLPLFGNRVDTRIQLKPLADVKILDLIELTGGFKQKGMAEILESVDTTSFVTLKPKAMTIEALTEQYTANQVTPKRMVHAALKPMMAKGPVAEAMAQFPLAKNFADVFANLNLDLFKIFGELGEQKANVEYEELRCVGLDSDRDALGAIVRVKKSFGYTGSLCSQGSQEYVAFWADWDNDGTFEEYLGTAFVNVHDVALPDGEWLDYAVRLETDSLLEHLRTCKSPNVVRIRAVLSWNNAPSTTDPDDLETWGNRIDVVVLLRSTQKPAGVIDHRIYYIGNVPIQQISQTTHLAYPATGGPANSGNDRPWGGAIRVQGRLLNAPTPVYYKLTYRRAASSDEPLPISASETFTVDNPGGGPLNPSKNVTKNATNGWFEYMNDINNLLATWRTTSALQKDGQYELALLWTNDPVANPNGSLLQTITITVCNLEFKPNPHATPTLDLSATLDHVIEEPTGGCRVYRKSGTETITGHARAVHPYFGRYELRIEPVSKSGTTVPSPHSGSYAAISGIEDQVWTIDPNTLPPCGYTVTLIAWDRTIVDNGWRWPHWAHKAVGFSVVP